MPLRTESLEEPQLNLTPMIDIVFLLIIFFMVGTRFTEIEQQYDIELPEATAVQPLTARPDALVINVARSGDIRIAGELLTMTQLQQKLAQAQSAYADQKVLIRGDGNGIYQSIIDVMDACHQANLNELSLGFQPRTAGESP